MKIVGNIEKARQFTRRRIAEGKTVALVPTMGALHEGHFSLIKAARNQCDAVIVSIFVNPTQFGPSEDLASYPSTPDADHLACERLGVDMIFAPDVGTMYGQDCLTEVRVKELSATMCGRDRPVHFAGVCTVVAKLFNIIPAHKAFFGAKDYQQAVIIRRMGADLNFPIEIVVCPTVREADGLALSSRNAYLSPQQRKQASALYASLKMADEMIRREHPPAGQVISAMQEHLAANAPDGRIDYMQILDPHTLRDVENTEQPVLVALAVKLGKARLIDNILVDESENRP